jgi:hypothetical protein
MVWFYTRADGQVRIETRIDPTTKEYVLQVERLGSPAAIERFPDEAAFDARIQALERELEADRWQLVSSEILPHGWRGPTSH